MNLGDSNVAGSGSLRDAINQSNAMGGTNLIQFTGAAASGTIMLNGGHFALPTITNNLTIQGTGASTLTVQRPASNIQQFGIFAIGPGVVCTIAVLTITGGLETSSDGGGIHNMGTLTVNDSVITGNATSGKGGGIRNEGPLLSVNRSTISTNVAQYGGGISNLGSLIMTDSTVADNLAAYGGGIDNYSPVMATRCTISGNEAIINGGGLDNLGTGNMTLDNCTLFGNTANGSGGGMRNVGLLKLVNSTISGNTATTGNGGGLSESTAAVQPVTLQNTILASNTASTGPDIYASPGPATVTANNCFIGTLAGATITGSNNLTCNPMLGPLQNNGGLTQTMALQPGSLAIDAGSNAFVTATTDQAGHSRIVNNRVDIGAYEFQPPATSTTLVSSVNPSSVGQSVTVTATVTGTAPGSNVAQGTFTFLDGG